MIAALMAGLVLGLSAGLSPGPLSVLVIAQTLRHSTWEGCKVAFAPLFTDAPIILLAMFALTQVRSQTILGSLSFAGGCFLLYLAWESWRTRGVALAAQSDAPQSILRGMMVNFLNPNPYIFWLTVGAPTTLKAWADTPLAAIGFIAGFYLCLVGSKILLAVLVGRSRRLFTGRAYVYLMRALAVLLVLFALMLFKDGLGMLG
jgi:threonine/homoserine/homoserine lactone efflux protein